MFVDHSTGTTYQSKNRGIPLNRKGVFPNTGCFGVFRTQIVFRGYSRRVGVEGGSRIVSVQGVSGIVLCVGVHCNVELKNCIFKNRTKKTALCAIGATLALRYPVPKNSKLCTTIPHLHPRPPRHFLRVLALLSPQMH